MKYITLKVYIPDHIYIQKSSIKELVARLHSCGVNIVSHKPSDEFKRLYLFEMQIDEGYILKDIKRIIRRYYETCVVSKEVLVSDEPSSTMQYFIMKKKGSQYYE